MPFLEKIKNKLINSSNSYNYYKTNFLKINDELTEKDNNLKILENELSKKESEIKNITEELTEKDNNLKILENELSKKESEINTANYRLDKMFSFDLLLEEKLSSNNNLINEILNNQNNLKLNLNNYHEDITSSNNMQNNALNKIEKILSQNNTNTNNKYENILEIINKEKTNLNNKYENINSNNTQQNKTLNKIEQTISQNNTNTNNKYENILEIINKEKTELNGVVSKLDQFIKKQNENQVTFKNNLNIIEDYYNNCRKYFFKGQEQILKQNMDTNFLFNFCYFNNIEFLSYSPNENLMLLKTKNNIIIGTNNHLWTIMEIYALNEYMIPILYDFDEFVVFDIGMNRAYASLNFASMNNCSFVYGFEIDEYVYSKALDNISLNPKLSKKIKTFNFGLSNEDGLVDLYCYDGFDGVNTMMDEYMEVSPVLQNYKDKLNVKSAQVKKASRIISDIISEDKIQSKIVLKIDTEGAEYNIINDLIQSNTLNKIDVILGEGHIFGNNDFKEDLLDAGFKIVNFDVSEATYNFAFIKNEYFKYWPLLIR